VGALAAVCGCEFGAAAAGALQQADGIDGKEVAGVSRVIAVWQVRAAEGALALRGQDLCCNIASSKRRTYACAG
jgi:hypothetical protein